MAYQGPDLVLQIRGGDVLSRSTPPPGSLAAALAGGTEMGTVPVVYGSARETDGPALLHAALTDAPQTRPSEIRSTLLARSSRDPLTVANVLAEKYPQTPLVSYIPSVAWANTLRLSDITKDDALRQKVLNETRPWTSCERPLFGERVALTAVAGTLIYAELARRGDEAARSLAVQGADEALKVAPAGYAQHGAGWTDDMFREDGVFVHFTDGRVAWGRGNGFAALGLTETLTALPALARGCSTSTGVT